MSAQAFIAFLRCEANQAEERARHLRATAAAIEANVPDDGNRKKRKRETGKPKRQHTAYTIFVQENYELIKKNHDPNMASKDIIALIARQWAATSEEEKQLWKERAVAQSEQNAVHEHVPDETLGLAEGIAHLDDMDDGDDSKDKGKKKRAVRKVNPKVSAAV